MENFGASSMSDISSAVRKKRSNSHPRNDSQLPLDYKDASSLSNISKGSSDENIDCGSVTRKKEIHLNLCSSRASFSNNIAESKFAKNVIKNEDGGFGDFDETSNNVSFRDSNEQRQHGGVDSQRSSKGVLAPANWKSTSNSGNIEVNGDDLDNDNKVKKVLLRVGGVTRIIIPTLYQMVHLLWGHLPQNLLAFQMSLDSNRSLLKYKGSFHQILQILFPTSFITYFNAPRREHVLGIRG